MRAGTTWAHASFVWQFISLEFRVRMSHDLVAGLPQNAVLRKACQSDLSTNYARDLVVTAKGLTAHTLAKGLPSVLQSSFSFTRHVSITV